MTPSPKSRLRYTAWQVFPGAYFGLGLAAIAAALIPLLTQGPSWPLWALAALSIATPLGYALTVWARKGSRFPSGPVYVTQFPGATPLFSRGDWEEFYDDWWSDWEPWAKRNGYTREELHADVEILVLEIAPTIPSTLAWLARRDETPEGQIEIPDVDPDTPGDQSWGQHHPGARAVEVYHERALGAVMEHELDLLAAEIAAVRDGPLERKGPLDSIEQEKIEWMEKQGIR